MHMHSTDAEQSLGIRWPIVARIVRRWVSNTSLAHFLWSGGAIWVTTVWSAHGWPCVDRLIPGWTRARHLAGGGACRRGGGPFRCDGGKSSRPSDRAAGSSAPRHRSRRRVRRFSGVLDTPYPPISFLLRLNSNRRENVSGFRAPLLTRDVTASTMSYRRCTPKSFSEKSWWPGREVDPATIEGKSHEGISLVRGMRVAEALE